ncbi:MAG: SDR family NAD(P)-dependent oxidoreductase, partial [Catenulispora sp.]|nr:SDR family NAD(P)-dependent oxidoreductase [Catenulispora sp.]
GTPITWTTTLPTPTPPHHTELPTYPFQHQRYWLDTVRGGDASSLGLDPVDHALLNASVSVAGSQTLVFSGRLARRDLPWLGDHAVAGTVLLPGAAFLELACEAAERLGYDQVDELTLHQPLLLPAESSVQVQVTVEPADDSGRRPVAVYSCPVTREENQEEKSWTRHAVGAIGTAEEAADASGSGESAPGAAAWPPAGATPLPLDDFYDGLADRGYEYGPAFQGVVAAWQRGDDVYAQVAVPEDLDTARFGIHPALLDAALHPLLATRPEAEAGQYRLPFSWSSVVLHSRHAKTARVHLRLPADKPVSLSLTDTSGAPVLSVGALAVRSIPREQLDRGASPADDALFTVRWLGMSDDVERSAVADVSWAVLGRDVAEIAALRAAVTEGGSAPDAVVAVVGRTPSEDVTDDVPGSVRNAVREALGLVQAWIDGDVPAGARLVVLTRDAVAVDGHDAAGPDLAGAAVRGLLRTAQTEHPDRFVLIDTDFDLDFGADPLPDSDDASSGGQPGRNALIAALRIALHRDEPELAIRAGAVFAPRIVPAVDPAGPSLSEPPSGPVFTPDSHVLITGGTGTLGSITARHLVTDLGVRNLTLVSRRGADAPGADDLHTELTAQGATVTIAACDVADRDALAALLTDLAAEHPITAVVHTAGTLDDATISTLTDEQLDAVLSPKADAAWNLHELTADLELTAFVVFSSVAGVLGAAGQAHYAAANAFLDALAQHRRRLGRPGTSLAWGWWRRTSGMTADLGHADRARMAREGLLPISDEQGMALFDAGTADGAPALIPARLDRAALRAQAAEATLQ